MYYCKVPLFQLLLVLAVSCWGAALADSSVVNDHDNGKSTTTRTAMNRNTTMILIEDFAEPRHSWKVMNDPVMGGESTGSVTIKDGLGIFDGKVVNVPFLDAPGFIVMKTSTISTSSFPDVSACSSLALSVRASEEYHGYRISFGNVHVPGGRFAFGYKAPFDTPVGNEFVDVVIPFTNFSARWDDATGDQIVTCQEQTKYCPTPKSLQDLKSISIWGEGVAGTVHLEIKTISAVGCDAATTPTDVMKQDDDKNKIAAPDAEDDYVANVEQQTDDNTNEVVADLEESGVSLKTSHSVTNDNNSKKEPSAGRNHHVLLQLFLSASIAAAGIIIFRSKHRRRRNTYDPVGSVDMNLVV